MVRRKGGQAWDCRKRRMNGGVSHRRSNHICPPRGFFFVAFIGRGNNAAVYMGMRHVPSNVGKARLGRKRRVSRQLTHGMGTWGGGGGAGGI